MSRASHENIDRRSFLQQGFAGAGAASFAAGLTPAQEKPARTIRVGVIGVGPRGQWHVRNLLSNHPDVTVTAICDIQQDRLDKAIALVKELRGSAPAGYSKDEYDYRNLCQRDDVEAVLIATPVDWLGRMTVDALRAGKHAALEVAGPQTEEESWEMVRAKQKSGKHVMLLENCCYGNENLMIYGMIKRGIFGEPYYAEGSYVHDCRFLFFDSAGKITWRGEMQRDRSGSTYPQHGLGSNCKWLEINDGDRLVECQTMMASGAHESHLRTVSQFGPASEQARIQFQEGDFVTSLISTAKGRMIRIDYSICCTRPYSRYYLLQGAKGCWDSRSGIFLEGVTPGKSGAEGTWEPLEKYQPQYQHSYWRESGNAAKRAGGHGGIDYYCISDFVKMLREDKEPWIDVYDAAAWSAIIYCSKLSLDRRGARVAMPDFTEGRWKDPNWRKDRMAIS
ncbi:MAG TPA: Gfo/Idh/MocA family oxidoreductase [Bryobacteraceae bacterium]|nr:Gfo/Idh/MocA family oxidoreductase [Bryobacteraceae bacterium]